MGAGADGSNQSELVCVGHFEARYLSGTFEEVLLEIFDSVTSGHAITECGPGMILRKAVPEAEEQAERSGTVPTLEPALPAPPAVLEDPPQDGSVAGQEDTPKLQGAVTPAPAPPMFLDRQAANFLPMVNRNVPSHSVYDQFAPVPARDAISFLAKPPANDGDFDAMVRRALRNEPEPGRAHPTHAGPMARRTTSAADPVDLASGAFTIDVVDLTVPTAHAAIAMQRSYRSGRTYFGPFGHGWDHRYNVYLRPLAGGSLALWTGRLQEVAFKPAVTGYESDAQFAGVLEAVTPERFTLSLPGGDVWRFERPSAWSDADRIPLVELADRHGNLQRLGYDAEDRLASVLDDADRGLVFGYGSCGLLEHVADHTGARVVRYDHDPEIEHLVRVALPATTQYPAGATTSYDYDVFADHPAMQHNIVRVRDSDGRVAVENEFAGPEAGWSFNAVVHQRLGDFDYRFDYEQVQFVWPDPLFVDVPATRTLVRPPDGSLHTHSFNYRGDQLEYRCRFVRDGSNRVAATRFRYDAAGNLLELRASDGQRTVYSYDHANPDPRARHNLLKVERVAALPGIVPSRTVLSCVYEPRYQLPLRRIDEGGATTKFSYDFDISPSGASGRLVRIDYPTTIDADGTPQSAAQLFEHNGHGQITAMVSAEGHRTEYRYAASGPATGRLEQVIADPLGEHLATVFDYDASGFLASVEAPGHRVTLIACNALGQVETTTPPATGIAPGQTRHWFDDGGGVVRVERPGEALQPPIADLLERDALGRVRTVTRAAGTPLMQQWRYAWDHEGRMISSWDPLGTRTERVYREDGALLRETEAVGDPAARSRRNRFDLAGRLTGTVDNWGAVREVDYDLWGRPSRMTLPDGAALKLNYGGSDLVIEERIEVTDPGAGAARTVRLATFDYDARGRRIRETRHAFVDDVATATALVTSIFYDREDNIRMLRLPRGAKYSWLRDALGRPKVETDPYGNIRRSIYDSSGDLTEIEITEVDAGIARTVTRSNTYDARGQLVRSELLGAITEVAYDERGVPIRRRSADGVVSSPRVDALGRLVENVVDPDGLALVSTYAFDMADRLVGFLDPMGRETRWRHDAVGRVVERIMPDGALHRFDFDDVARTVKQILPSGGQIRSHFTPTRQLEAVHCVPAPGAEPVADHQFDYDGLGQLVRAAVGGAAIERGYDSLGRLIREAAEGETVRHIHDDLLGAHDLIYPDGRRERTETDATGRPTRVILTAPGSLGGAAGTELLRIGYSDAGRATRFDYGNGVSADWAYDALGRAIRVDVRRAGTLLDSSRVQHDDNGHRALVQTLGPSPRTTLFGFDGRGRLVEARESGTPTALADASPSEQASGIVAVRGTAGGWTGRSYDIDPSDVRTAVTPIGGAGAGATYTSALDHRPTTVDGTSIEHTVDGARIRDDRFVYDLDALNRVRRIRDRATDTILREYEYDAVSRPSVERAGGQTVLHRYIGEQRVQDASGAGLQQRSPHPLLRGPFVLTAPTGARFVQHDQGQSSLCLTDAGGALVERHRHGDFGEPVLSTADGKTLPAGDATESWWRGMAAIAGTALYRTPSRIYDATLGVFAAPDPLLYLDSPSAYAFAAHNPIDFADPTGMQKSPLGELDADGLPVQTVAETVITVPKPFDPIAFAHQGDRGKIQVGDVVQSGKGLYNGFVGALPYLVGPLLGRAVPSLGIPRATIDEHYGGAALMGEKLGENLAFEAAAGLPWLGRLAARALESRFLADAVRAPAMMFVGAGGLGGFGMSRRLVKAGLYYREIEVGAEGVEAVGYVTSSQKIAMFGDRVVEDQASVYNALARNPGTAVGPQGISEGFARAAFENPKLMPAAFGKSYERLAGQELPQVSEVLGGAYQPDAVIMLGRQRVNVDWTTVGKLEAHLQRPYLQRGFLILLHPGLPRLWL